MLLTEKPVVSIRSGGEVLLLTAGSAGCVSKGQLCSLKPSTDHAAVVAGSNL